MTKKEKEIELTEEEISPEKLKEIEDGFKAKKKHFGPEELYK